MGMALSKVTKFSKISFFKKFFCPMDLTKVILSDNFFLGLFVLPADRAGSLT
jgi:hypothetical protein